MSTIEQNRKSAGRGASEIAGAGASLSLEVAANHLVELLEGASTHADKGKSAVRTLNSVQLVGESGYLTARATDRYRLIEGKIEVKGGDLATSLVSLEDIKRVIELVKSNKLANWVSITRIGDLLTVSVSGGSITLQLLDSTFPATAHLLGQPFNPSGSDLGVTDTVSFSPALFADYAKIVGKGNPVTITFTGKNKPMLIGLIGDKVEWRALLMPMRFSN